MSAGQHSFGVLGGESVLCPLQLPVAAGILSLVAAWLQFLLPWSHYLFVLCLSPSSLCFSLIRTLVIGSGPAWIIQEDSSSHDRSSYTLCLHLPLAVSAEETGKHDILSGHIAANTINVESERTGSKPQL